MPRQLTLAGIEEQRNEATFSNFYSGENQALQTVLAVLQRFSALDDEQFIYLYGHTGVGKTHLLQSCCHHANQHGVSAIYLPLDTMMRFGVEAFSQMENLQLVCIDDVDCLAGDPQWEEALFHLYNRLRDGQARLLVAGSKPAQEVGITLADLVSRLTWGVSFQLAALTDQDKAQVLALRAQKRGFKLSEQVIKFLLHRCSRNMRELMQLFDKLDKAQLTAKHALTIPFVKAVLAEDEQHKE